MKVRTRFAPSPTGYLHIGNLRSALYAYLFARKHGGDFLLRIEDTDQERLVPGAVEVIYRTLQEVGMSWDEGPDVGGPVGPYVQSQRKDIYAGYAQVLLQSGSAYRCFCTKEELDARRDAAKERGETFKYDKHCRRLSRTQSDAKAAAGIPYVVRQDVPEKGQTTFYDEVFGAITVDNDTLDDNVLMKADGFPTYNFANVVDDRLMGITHVMRGTEYLSSTPKYNLLYEAFGWEVPKYIHMTPIMRDAAHKLSKRDGDASYEDFIKKGYLKEALVNYIALLGWSPGNDQEKFTLEELCAAFDISGLSKSPAIFDPQKLIWLNALYIRELPRAAFLAYARPWLAQAGAGEMDEDILTEILQPRVEYFAQIPGMLSFLAQPDTYGPELFYNKKSKTDPAVAASVLKAVMPGLQALPSWDRDSLQTFFSDCCQAHTLKKGTLMYPVRIALSGRTVTPGGAVELAALLGRDESLKRLNNGFIIAHSA